MTKKIKTLLFLSIFLILLFSAFSFTEAQEWPGLVPCNNTSDNGGDIPKEELCDFDAFMGLINNIIDFTLFFLALPIAAVMFCYAGFKLVISGGNSEARGKAKNIFTNAVIGIALAAGAWIIIKTLLVVVGYKDIETFFLI